MDTFFVEANSGLVKVKINQGSFSLIGKNADLPVAHRVLERLAPYPQLLSAIIRDSRNSISFAVTPKDVAHMIRLTPDHMERLYPAAEMLPEAILFARQEAIAPTDLH